MIETILELLSSVASIVDKEVPGFAEQTASKINDLRTEYADEMGKSIDDIDAAKLDSLDFELRNLIGLFRTTIQPENNPTKS